MANIKSQIKRIRTSRKAYLSNQAVKSSLKTYIRHFEEALEKGQEEAKTSLDVAVRALDKAVSGGVIHKNNAANKKSALMKRYNTLLKEETKPAAEPALSKVEGKEQKARAAKKTTKTKTKTKTPTKAKTAAKKNLSRAKSREPSTRAKTAAKKSAAKKSS